MIFEQPKLPSCPQCGRWQEVISMYDVLVGPVCGDGAVCMRCGAISQYDVQLRLIAMDESANRRWLDEAPHAHECLHDLSDRVLHEARAAEEVAKVLGRWKPAADGEGEER